MVNGSACWGTGIIGMRDFLIRFTAAAGITRGSNAAAAVVAALSLIQLLRYGWNFGLSVPLEAILRTYNEILNTIFDILKPLLTPLFAFLSGLLSVSIDPGDHWRHIFVLLSILLMRFATYMWRSSQLSTTLFSFLIAILVGFAGSVASGSVREDPNYYMNSFGIAAAPVLSVFLYYFLVNLWRGSFERGGPNVPDVYKNQTWSDYMQRQMRPVFHRLVAGLIVASVIFIFSDVRHILASGILFLPFYIFGIALHGFGLGVVDTRHRRKKDETWSEAFWKTGNAQLGAAVIGVYVWCITLLIFDAGLQLAGFRAAG